MYNTLKSYHFGKLPQSLEDKAKKMIDDICPLGILNERTIDAVEVWGRDDILLLMRAMYNEAKKDLALTWKDIDLINYLYLHVMIELSGTDKEVAKEVLRRFNEQRSK